MADNFTELNPGSGGSVLDEEGVTYPSVPILRRRARVVLGGAVAGALAAVRNTPAELSDYGLVTRLVPDQVSSDFTKLLKFEPIAGEEIRASETDTDRYHGAAADGTLTSAASWKVVRFYKVSGKIERVRYRINVIWDARTAGW